MPEFGLLMCILNGVDILVQAYMHEERLYKELKDPKNYTIITALAKVFPDGLSVIDLVKTIGSTWKEAGEKGGSWHPIQRRIKLLEQQSLVRHLHNATSHAKEVPYTLASRALFEYGVMEEFFNSSTTVADAGARLANGLERSFLYHNVQVDEVKFRSVASLTIEFLRLGYFDELRKEVFSERIRELPLHRTHTENVAVFFIRAFLCNKLYLEKFLHRMSSSLEQPEVRRLFEDIKRQLWKERRSQQVA